MQINTSFDSKTELLKITAGTTSESSSSTTTTANSGSDTAEWSTAALSLSQSDSSGLVSPILQLKAENEILQQHLTSALATKLAEAGISVDQTITLTRDDDGTVQVVGDCADKEAIEKIFADEPSLTEAFNTLADNSELARSYTKSQTSSLVRTNGYAAYLDQLSSSSSSSDTSSSDFYYSLLNGDSATYFA
jgi:hypothetical protein